MAVEVKQRGDRLRIALLHGLGIFACQQLTECDRAFRVFEQDNRLAANHVRCFS
jgi:hypothetical protein